MWMQFVLLTPSKQIFLIYHVSCTNAFHPWLVYNRSVLTQTCLMPMNCMSVICKDDDSRVRCRVICFLAGMALVDTLCLTLMDQPLSTSTRDLFTLCLFTWTTAQTAEKHACLLANSVVWWCMMSAVKLIVAETNMWWAQYNRRRVLRCSSTMICCMRRLQWRVGWSTFVVPICSFSVRHLF